MRNNIIFGDGKAGIITSTEFLNNYMQTLTNIRNGDQTEDLKGKKPILEIKEIQPKQIVWRELLDGNHQKLDGFV